MSLDPVATQRASELIEAFVGKLHSYDEAFQRMSDALDQFSDALRDAVKRMAADLLLSRERRRQTIGFNRAKLRGRRRKAHHGAKP